MTSKCYFISIQSASNLLLVRISYLYGHSVLLRLSCFFWKFEESSSWIGTKTLVGHLKLSIKTTHQRKLAFSLPVLISLKNLLLQFRLSFSAKENKLVYDFLFVRRNFTNGTSKNFYS